MSEIYNRCIDQGITPENIACTLTDLLEFSKTVPFSEMPDYIQRKTNEKGKLEAKITELNDLKWKLIGDISNLETRHLVALDGQKITEDNLKWYSDIKAELGKNGLFVDDVSQPVRVVSGIKQHGFNTEHVLNEFSNLEMRKIQCQGYQGSIIRLKSQYDNLNREYSCLQQTVSSYNQTLSIYRELEAMRFGLKELKFLWYTVREIAKANNIPQDEAVQKFFNDVGEQYDGKVGLESQVEKLQAEVNRLKQQEANSRILLLLHPFVGSALLRLIQSGVSEQDIIAISEIFKANSRISIKIKEDLAFTKEEAQYLVCEVWKYIDIKSIVKELTKRAGKLRKEVSLLQIQTDILNEENEKYTHNKNNYMSNKDNGHNYYSHQEHESLEQPAKSNAWNYIRARATQASPDERTNYVDPQSKEEQNVKNTRSSIPMPHRIAWPPICYDIKKTISKEDTNKA